MSENGWQVSADEFATLLAEIDAVRARRAEMMPDAPAAIRLLFEAFERLREIGWREGIYAPKDGTKFEVIEAGSTGIFRCSYSGVWPDGYWITFDERDAYPSKSPPLLYRLLPADEAARKARMAAAAERFAREQRNG